MARPARRGLPAFSPDCSVSVGFRKTLQPPSVTFDAAVLRCEMSTCHAERTLAALSGCDKKKTVPCPAGFTRAIMDNKELEAKARILRPAGYRLLDLKDSCLLAISLLFQ